MIFTETKLTISDNSGITNTKCIRIINSSKKATIGSIILMRAIKKNHSRRTKKKALYFGLIIMVKQYYKRYDGIIIKFTDNRSILFSKAIKFIGSRIYGPMMKEIKSKLQINIKQQQKYLKVLSYSKMLI
jgi:large subunit ribosomal protein L14